MKIKRYMEENQRYQVDCGSHTKPKYEWVFDKKTGDKKLEAVGKIDFYQKIQDSAIGISLHDYIQRYERIRDPEILAGLADSKPVCVDLIGMPTDILDYQEKLFAVQGLFDKLPARYKEKYDNDRNSFAQAIWSGDLSIFGEQEVKSDGSDA